jgi:polyisoprenoid-binding protein YceI
MKPNTFIFKNPMMQEHFNENYMESDKYPKASLSGSIVGDFDLTKDGDYAVTVKGKLKVHGIEKEREIKGGITVRNGKVSIDAKFAIQVSDHGIKIPSMKIKTIAEVVEVSVSIEYKEISSK